MMAREGGSDARDSPWWKNQSFESMSKQLESFTGSVQLNRLPLDEFSVAWAAGAVAFPTTLKLAQVFVWLPLRVSSRLPMVAHTLGFMAVTVGGVVATSSAIVAVAFTRNSSSIFGSDQPSPSSSSPSQNISAQLVLDTLCRIKAFTIASWRDLYESDWSPMDVAVAASSSLITYRLLGGRFSHQIPSDLWKPGSFGLVRGCSIPARGKEYATGAQRLQIQSIGESLGCHSCGRRKGPFHADHMPPNKFAKEGEAQRYYAQCFRCSNKQGESVARGRRSLVTSVMTLRASMLWLPLPFLWVNSDVSERPVHSVDEKGKLVVNPTPEGSDGGLSSSSTGTVRTLLPSIDVFKVHSRLQGELRKANELERGKDKRRELKRVRSEIKMNKKRALNELTKAREEEVTLKRDIQDIHKADAADKELELVGLGRGVGIIGVRGSNQGTSDIGGVGEVVDMGDVESSMLNRRRRLESIDSKLFKLEARKSKLKELLRDKIN